MKGYPVMLDLFNRRAVVIGGGKIATRKVQTLLESSEANVTVVSPDITETLEQLAHKQQIHWYKKNFHATDIEDAFLVIAATNDKALNRMIAKQCHPHQLVNVVSEAIHGNFVVPASLRRGNLTIAVSTDGLHPSAAKRIRNELASVYDETFSTYIDTWESSTFRNGKTFH